MGFKIKISYSDKGKMIAKLYSNGSMVTLEWGNTIEEIIDKVSTNRDKLMNNYARDMYKTFLYLLERERNIFKVVIFL